MKSRAILIVLLTAIVLPASLACANFWDFFGAPAKTGEQKGEKPAAEAPFQDVLDTPALKSVHAAESLLTGVAVAGKRVVAVGQHGHIVYSDNLGKSWLQAAVPVSSDLLAVHFPTPQNGWAVGHDGVVLHSGDAGVTWSKQFDGRAAAQVMAGHYRGTNACSSCHDPGTAPTAKPGGAETAEMMTEIQKFIDQGPDKPFLDVWFESETTGFIVGAFNLIFRTTDGGKSWTPWYDRIDNPKHYHLYAIRPVGKDLFITSEQGTLFKLDPVKGRFREIKTSYTGTFFGITGKSGAVLAFGMRGNAFRSRDGGAKWQKVDTGVPVGLMGATLTADGRIVLVSQGGHVLVSSDDGGSFSQLKIERAAPAASVAALDGALALVGPRGANVQAFK
jgi:photosystem II stability/assembly factor-like uncharacterized protein